MRQIAFGRYFEKTARAAVGARFPVQALLELTSRCNFNCVHCYLPKECRTARGNELTAREACAIARRLSAAGCLVIGLTGGEVFLRPDLAGIVECCCRRGLRPVIFTNGSRIDEAACRWLKRFPVTLEVSCHAARKEVFERITRTPGSRARVFSSLERLRRHSIDFRVKAFCLKENKDEIARLKAFCDSRGLPFHIDAELFTSHNDAGATPLSYGEYRRLKQCCYPGTFAPRGERGRLLSVRDGKTLFYCGAGSGQVFINHRGDLRVCPLIDTPSFNIPSLGFGRSWSRLRAFMDALRPPANWECHGCADVRYCNWCPGRSFAFDKTLFSCDPGSREAAAFTRRVTEARG